MSPRWLSPEEQSSWRAWVAASTLLPHRLSKDLQQDAQITLADYEILMYLSESPCRRMRMSELAEATLSSRSRLSHQVDRLAAAGFIDRQPCPDDRRGSFAVLTEAGWSMVVQTAPAHVESVRQHLVDVLSPEEFSELGRLCELIALRLREPQEECPGDTT